MVKVLRGPLDDSAQPLLAQWRQQAAAGAGQELDLDLGPVTAVDLAGCHALLELLAHWHLHGVRVRLHSCEGLLAMLRESTQAAPPDGNGGDDASWELMIELLRLAGDVARYEEACLAYSLNFERSPPVAAAPATPATPTPFERRTFASPAFLLPALISLPVDPLLAALQAHAQQAGLAGDSWVLDASGLSRIDFHAVSPLLEGMSRLAGGKTVEWRGVSFLVSTLLHLTRGKLAPRIINRKP